jgi:CheY-like chemotaxis protein
MLEILGYKVTARTSSIEALEVFRGEAEKFDLVITDQTMPHMTGMELAGELLRVRPGIPILLCTGFSESVTEEKVKASGIRRFLLKPLIMRELATTIRQVLDQR